MMITKDMDLNKLAIWMFKGEELSNNDADKEQRYRDVYTMRDTLVNLRHQSNGPKSTDQIDIYMKDRLKMLVRGDNLSWDHLE